MALKLNIYVRQDLKMRKGKMAAQSAHTAQKLLLEATTISGSRRYLKDNAYADFKAWMVEKPIVVNMVRDDVELHDRIDLNKPYAKIIDSGRTEFAGVPTLTCASQGIFSASQKEELQAPSAFGMPIQAKQLYVFSKQFPLSKDRACEMAAVGCLVYHDTLMQVDDQGSSYLEVSVDTEFGRWVSGPFAKIALGIPTDDELLQLKEHLKANGIRSILQKSGSNTLLVIEPKFPENIDPHTRHLSLI